jgi:GNAT superfamily N-acetyltransferase
MPFALIPGWSWLSGPSPARDQNGAFAPAAVEQSTAMEPALERSQKARLEIRRAGPAELDAAYGIVAEYYEAVQVVARESRERFAQDYFAATAGVWLAWMDGQIAGCIALRSLNNAETAEIKRMYVRAAWRGHGMAQKLLEEAECFAQKNGYRWIYLDTTGGMVAAAQLYRSNGYELCERYNENPQATIFMRKRLEI